MSAARKQGMAKNGAACQSQPLLTSRPTTVDPLLPVRTDLQKILHPIKKSITSRVSNVPTHEPGGGGAGISPSNGNTF